jgi:hypothetical protein
METTRTKSWIKFISESSAENPWSLAYKIAKDKIFAPKLSELLDCDGNPVIEETQIANKLFDFLFPNESTCNESEKQQHIRAQSQGCSYQCDDWPFSQCEVNDVIYYQNPNRAPGEDGITADIIAKTHGINREFLCQLYNKCLSLHYFPKIWKKGIIKIIPKPNKPDYREPDAYRPITLISVLAKVLEKLLTNRITHYLHQNSRISEKQFGFTKQKSTEDAIHSLIKFVKSAYERKGFALIISLDINGAFNSAWWPKIINQLRVKGCPSNLFSIIKSYFSGRESKLWYMNTEVVRQMTVGCPQGSASGPWFWNICIDDIFELSEGNDCNIECFADDTIIKIFAKTIEELEIIANNKLRQVFQWSLDNKLTFNVSKSNCVLFTRNLKYKAPEIAFNGDKLALNSNFKHLGVIIDSKLSWRAHSNHVKSKVLQFTNNLLRFAKTNYGLGSRSIEVILKGGHSANNWIRCLNLGGRSRPEVRSEAIGITPETDRNTNDKVIQNCFT